MKPGAWKCLFLLVPVVLLLSAKTSVGSSDEIGRDANFVAFANGVVADTQTGLEWIAGPDEDTSYYQAAAWVRSLTIAGGGWRMPTDRELRTLCREPGNLSTLTPLLQTTGIHIWPYQEDENQSLYGFRYMDPYGTRGFAVRSASGSQRIDPAQPRRPALD